MTQEKFLKIILPLIAIPALIGLILPGRSWTVYSDIIEPICLATGSFLSLKLSSLYSKELKTAYVFLSVFLLTYAIAILLFLSNSPLLVPVLKQRLEPNDLLAVIQVVQFINYVLLFIFCLNVARVIRVTELNRQGWLVVTVTVILCIFLAIYPVLPFIKQISSQFQHIFPIDQ